MTTTYAGQIILADHNNDALTYAVPMVALKLSDAPARASTVTTADDPDLVLTFEAGRIYDIELHLLHTSAANAAGDLLGDFAWTGTATLTYGIHGPHNTIASGTQSDLESAAFVADSTSASSQFVVGCSTTANWTTGKIEFTASTASTLTFRWAQFNSSVNGTVVKAGSKLIARRRS